MFGRRLSRAYPVDGDRLWSALLLGLPAVTDHAGFDEASRSVTWAPNVGGFIWPQRMTVTVTIGGEGGTVLTLESRTQYRASLLAPRLRRRTFAALTAAVDHALTALADGAPAPLAPRSANRWWNGETWSTELPPPQR